MPKRYLARGQAAGVVPGKATDAQADGGTRCPPQLTPPCWGNRNPGPQIWTPAGGPHHSRQFLGGDGVLLSHVTNTWQLPPNPGARDLRLRIRKRQEDCGAHAVGGKKARKRSQPSAKGGTHTRMPPKSDRERHLTLHDSVERSGRTRHCPNDAEERAMKMLE